MKKTLLTFLLSLLVSLSQAAPEIKGNPQELKSFLHPVDNVVTISGYADEKAYSDQAIISLVITTESELLSEAIEKNSSLRGKLTGQLLQGSLSEEAIKSSKFSSTPQYGWYGKKPNRYKVVNRMSITVGKEDQFKEVAAVADCYEDVEFSGTVFEHTQEDVYREKVKAKALEKIIEQKEFYETSLGVKLTPIGIFDSKVAHQATRGAMILDEFVVGLQDSEGSYVPKFAKHSRVNQSTSSFDEIQYEANLSVKFKIEPPAKAVELQPVHAQP